MKQNPNLNDDEEGKIESEEYGPLPSLDYQFFEYMQEGVTVYTLMRDESGKITDLIITYANIAAYRQKKSLKKGLIGKSIEELYGHEAVAFDLEKANEVISTGRGTKYEVYFSPLDKYFSVTAFSQKEDLYITLTTDITRRKKAEEEMHIEHQKLLDIIEFLPDATFVIDENKKVIAWNKAIEEMTGTPKEEIIGKGEYAYSVPFYGDRRPIIIDLIFLSEKEIESKYTYVKREGKTLFAEIFVSNLFGGRGAFIFVKASPLYDKNGNLVGSIETVRDITGQKKAEERTKMILEGIAEAYFELDNEWRFVDANEKVAEILGKKREELIGNVIWDVIPEAKSENTYKQYYKAKEENIPVHFEIKSPLSGEWYEIHVYPAETGLTVYVHNIDELKKAECPSENQ